MSELVVDLNAGPRVLAAARNMLNELLNEAAGNAHVGTEKMEISGAAQDDLNGTYTRERDPAGGKGVTGPSEGGDDTSPNKIDTKGIAFDCQFCGDATEPFYSSGKRKGQWKKRRGLSEAQYDAWYSKQTPASTADRAGTQGGQINTGAAFGAGQKPAGPPVPKDCGSFMGWVAAKQADGMITQEDVGEAYTKTGVTVTDLFPPNSEEVVAQHVAALYGELVTKAGA